jgi:hypothetical protein
MKRTFKILISLLVVALLSSCSTHQPRVDQDSLLVELKKYDPTLKREHFVSTSIDLNDDKCADAVAFMTQKSRYCGKRGCVMLVMLCEEGKLKPIGRTNYVNPIVSTSRQKTLGLKNIDVVIRPKGEKPHQVTLRYNGKFYPVSALFGQKVEKRILDRILFK